MNDKILLWLHFGLLVAPTLLFIPLVKLLYPVSDYALWLLLTTFVSLFLVLESGYGQSYYKQMAFFTMGGRYVIRYGETPEVKSGFSDFILIQTFDKTVMVSAAKTISIMLVVFAVFSYLLAEKRLGAMGSEIEANISFFMAILASATQGVAHLLFHRVLAFDGYVRAKRRELSVLWVRFLLLGISLLVQAPIYVYFAIQVTSFACIAMLHYQACRSLTAFSIDVGKLKKNEGLDCVDMSGYDAGRVRQSMLNVGSAAILSGVGLVSAQLESSRDAALGMVTNRLLNVLKNFSQVPVLSVIASIAKTRVERGLRAEFARFALVHYSCIAIFLVLAVIISALNSLFYVASGEALIVTNQIYWLFVIITALELHHSGFAQLYQTKNHIPFLIPSILSGACIIGGGIIAIGYGFIYLILWQGIIQLAFNNWYPLYLVWRECQFEGGCVKLK